MENPALTEIRTALQALSTDIVATIPWDVLNAWSAANSLAIEQYAQIGILWDEVWQKAFPTHMTPTVYLYHGTTKLTLVRENMLCEPCRVSCGSQTFNPPFTNGYGIRRGLFCFWRCAQAAEPHKGNQS